ncbi:XRE family transcriptional regulator [Methylobacterium sp. E-041]|nr:XRE family transcriptional regulator [Methylobacterium sp. E-041]
MTGSELARLLETNRQNVSRWVSGTRELVPAVAQQIAPLLQTTSAELLLLRSTERFSVPLGGKIVGGGAIDVSTDQHEPGLEYEIELSVRVPDATVAYQVIGESMMPVYRPDTVIICRAHTKVIDPLVGKELAVATVDHGRMLKVVHPGSTPGHYDLSSFNATTMRDVRLEWVARIAAIIPADEWRILERRSQVNADMRTRLQKPSKRQK